MLNENEKILPEIPPNDFEAEQGVIGSMIFDKESIDIAYEALASEDFYRLEHKFIFEAIVNLYMENSEVDPITLKAKLEEMDKFNDVGGIDYIITVSNAVSTSALIKDYIKIVREKSIRRKILKASKQINKLSFDNTKSVEYIITDLEKILQEALSTNFETSEFEPIQKILANYIEKLENIYKNKSRIVGIETGFKDFDFKTSGLQNSDFILIAARPSMGKTAFAINIAQHISIKKNIPTAIFSLEMSKEQLISRMISAEGLIEGQKLRSGELLDKDWSRLAEAVSIISSAPIFIDDTPGISVSELRAKCRKLKKEKNLGLIVIDYLQLMTSGIKNESRQHEISTISRALKGLARELNIPIIALSQLSRAVEQRRPPRPMLSDIRESGAIEQDADVVCFLYREEYYDPSNDEKRGQAEVIIAKQRNGSIGTIDLSWDGRYTLFSNLERQYSNI